LERGDSQFHLHIQGAILVSLEMGRVQELVGPWGTWVHFECSIPTGPNYNVMVKIRPIDNRNTFQFLAGYCMKNQERNRHRVVYMSPSIDMEWLMQAKAMHARLKEGSPFKKKTLLEPRNITKHMLEFHHRHLMPLDVAPPQLLRFMCLSGYYAVSPSFATCFGKISYERYVHQESVARDLRYTSDCNVLDFLYLVDYGPPGEDYEIPYMNAAYNTCTFDEAVRMANNAGMELAQEGHGIMHDALDDDDINNDRHLDPNLAPDVSDNDGDVTEDDADM
jgi:hypothetical protein